MFHILFILNGVISVFLQIFFLRELIPVFHGNEFVLGIVIAHWLFAAGVSNYLFRYIKIPKNVGDTIIKLMFVLVAFIVFSFVFIRSVNLITVTDITEGISLKTAFVYSFVSIFPVSFLINLILSFLKSYSVTMVYRKNIQRYIYEAIGFIIGGVIITCFMTSMSTVAVLAAVVSLICVEVIYLLEARILKLFFILLVSFFLYLVQNYGDYIDKASISNNYSGNNVIDFTYFGNQQNILTEKNGEFFLYVNGAREFALPSPEIFEEEDFAHLPILHHESPKNILVIGGIKYIQSIVKYGFKEIDFIETNSVIVPVIKKHISKLNSIFDDKRLKIYHDDAREFLINGKNKYDVVLVGLDIPINTEINKFYTKDFFNIIINKLTDDGFLALKLPGSMVYSAPLMSELNSSVYNSLKQVFEYVQIIPGKENILVASKSPMPFRFHIKERLKEVENETFVLSKYYLDERMDTQKTKWLKFQMNKRSNLNLENTDANQKAMIFSIMYWQSHFSPFLMKFFTGLIEYSYLFAFVGVLLFFSMKFQYTVTAFVSGASAMWLQMICFWGFQIYVGQIYRWFGFLTAIFMTGLVIGALCFKYGHKPVALNKTFFSSEVLYLLWIVMYVVIVKCQLLNMYSLFVLSFGTGFITGLEFSQLIKIFAVMKEGDSNAKIFSSDAFGGCFAGYAGGAFIIPVWGIYKSLMFILFLKFLIFTWWHYNKKHGL